MPKAALIPALSAGVVLLALWSLKPTGQAGPTIAEQTASKNKGTNAGLVHSHLTEN